MKRGIRIRRIVQDEIPVHIATEAEAESDIA